MRVAIDSTRSVIGDFPYHMMINIFPVLKMGTNYNSLDNLIILQWQDSLSCSSSIPRTNSLYCRIRLQHHRNDICNGVEVLQLISICVGGKTESHFRLNYIFTTRETINRREMKRKPNSPIPIPPSVSSAWLWLWSLSSPLYRWSWTMMRPSLKFVWITASLIWSLVSIKLTTASSTDLCGWTPIQFNGV